METENLAALLAQKTALFLVRAAGVLVSFVLAWLVAGWASRATQRSLEKTRLDATLTRFLAALLRYALILGALVACLGAVGFQTTSFAALVGAIGIAVGLAFQNTLSNFAAGVMLLLFRPFRVGDTIRVAHQLGMVDSLELFTTRLTASDNRKISIPNASIFNQVLENMTYHPTRRVEVAVTSPFEIDLDAARSAFERGLGGIERVLSDPPPEAHVQDLAGGVNWQLRAWCKTEDYARVHQQVVRTAKQVLDQVRPAPGKPQP